MNTQLNAVKRELVCRDRQTSRILGDRTRSYVLTYELSGGLPGHVASEELVEKFEEQVKDLVGRRYHAPDKAFLQSILTLSAEMLPGFTVTTISLTVDGTYLMTLPSDR